MTTGMNLQRLVDDPEADLNEVSLLRAGKTEAMSDGTRRKVLAGIGIGGGTTIVPGVVIVG